MGGTRRYRFPPKTAPFTTTRPPSKPPTPSPPDPRLRLPAENGVKGGYGQEGKGDAHQGGGGVHCAVHQGAVRRVRLAQGGGRGQGVRQLSGDGVGQGCGWGPRRGGGRTAADPRPARAAARLRRDQGQQGVGRIVPVDGASDCQGSGRALEQGGRESPGACRVVGVASIQWATGLR